MLAGAPRERRSSASHAERACCSARPGTCSTSPRPARSTAASGKRPAKRRTIRLARSSVPSARFRSTSSTCRASGARRCTSPSPRSGLVAVGGIAARVARGTGAARRILAAMRRCSSVVRRPARYLWEQPGSSSAARTSRRPRGRLEGARASPTRPVVVRGGGRRRDRRRVVVAIVGVRRRELRSSRSCSRRRRGPVATFALTIIYDPWRGRSDLRRRSRLRRLGLDPSCGGCPSALRHSVASRCCSRSSTRSPSLPDSAFWSPYLALSLGAGEDRRAHSHPQFRRHSRATPRGRTKGPEDRRARRRDADRHVPRPTHRPRAFSHAASRRGRRPRPFGGGVDRVSRSRDVDGMCGRLDYRVLGRDERRTPPPTSSPGSVRRECRADLALIWSARDGLGVHGEPSRASGRASGMRVASGENAGHRLLGTPDRRRRARGRSRARPERSSTQRASGTTSGHASAGTTGRPTASRHEASLTSFPT